MQLPMRNLILWFDTSKCRDIATDATLFAVDRDFNLVAVNKLVSMCCGFEFFSRVIMNRELKRFVCCFKRETFFATYREIASVAVVAVLLRNKIVVFKVRDFALRRVWQRLFCRNSSRVDRVRRIQPYLLR